MMKTMKTILLGFVAALVMISCAEDPTPPVAGFSVSSDAVVQWDIATITSTATGAEETVYAITGGAYEMDDATGSVQFLDAATYTITQTVTNTDGSNDTSQDVVASAPVNTYNFSFLGTSDLSLIGNAYWFDSQGTLQIRFDGAGESAQETNNLAKVIPVTGPDDLHGTGTRSYTWSDADPAVIGTYNSQFTSYPATGTSWEGAWFSPIAGDGVEVTLVYEDAITPNDNVYDIKVMDTTWDEYYAGFTPTAGDGVLSLMYRGVITPPE